jgi:hypothetical protein
MKARLKLGAILVLALVLPAVAQASLPSTKNTSIVPAKSLGGVKLGSSLAAASGAWGKGGTCGEASCGYEGKSKGAASFLLSGNKVVEANIALGRVGTTTKLNFNTPLTQFRTAKGIGLGSTVSQLKSAYAGLKKVATDYYNLPGPGTSATGFTVLSGRVESIRIQSQPLG